MKRARLGPGAKSLQRGSTFKRTARQPVPAPGDDDYRAPPPRELKRRPGRRKRRTGKAARFYRPETTAFREAAQQQGACMNPRCPDPARRWTAHHVVYRQHLIDEGHPDLYPPADAMRLCEDCHANYHARSLRLPADVLPPAAIEFAHALLGERASDYLARYYPAS